MGDVARRYPHMDIWGGCRGTVHLDEIVKNVLEARRAVAAGAAGA
jgi:homocysteine S-methyltransferase